MCIEAQPTDIAWPSELLLDRRRHHGRHAEGLRDPFGFDQIEHGRRIEGGHDDLRRPEEDRLEHADRTGGVEHRRHDQVAVVTVHRLRELDVPGVRDQVAVRQHDALAEARGAARVEESRQIVLVDRAGGEGRRLRRIEESFVLTVVDSDHPVDQVGQRARVAVAEQDAVHPSPPPRRRARVRPTGS